MLSKPVGFVLLALGCLTAAGGGAYLATRHNMSDAAVAPRTSTAAPLSATQAPAQPVAETEATVTSPKAEAPPAEHAPAEHPPAEAPTPDTPRHSEAPAPRHDSPAGKSPAAATATARVNGAPATHPVQRTVPVPGTGAPAPSSDPVAIAQTTPPAASNAGPPKMAEGIRPVEPPQPEPVRVPQYDELILPASSVIGLQVETSASSERARVEDRIEARVSRDVMAGGRVAIPAGSRVVGTVTVVERGGKMKDTARLGIRFHTLVLADGSQVQLHTDPVYRLGEPPAAESTKKIGGAAIGGAILGAILGGGKGAAIGGATGAAGGTAAVMAGDRNPATLRQGEYLNVKLAGPATITVERHEQ